MKSKVWAVAGLLSWLLAAPAMAAPVCNAATHQKFGETRAFFQDVLAGCAADGACYVVTHVPDDGRGFQYLQQIRVQHRALDAPMELRFVSVDPMADPRGPFALSIDDFASGLSGHLNLTPQSANEYFVTDMALADELIGRITKARTATWLYRSDKGEMHAARFGLRGAPRAFAWMDCMQRRQNP